MSLYHEPATITFRWDVTVVRHPWGVAEPIGPRFTSEETAREYADYLAKVGYDSPTVRPCHIIVAG